MILIKLDNTSFTLMMIAIVTIPLLFVFLCILHNKKKHDKGLYKNVIKDENVKVNFINNAIYLLDNANKIDMEDLGEIKIEFAYLLQDYFKISYITLFKVTTKDNENYYFSTDDSNNLFAIDNTKMNDFLFYSTRDQMFELHHITDYNPDDYNFTISKN